MSHPNLLASMLNNYAWFWFNSQGRVEIDDGLTTEVIWFIVSKTVKVSHQPAADDRSTREQLPTGTDFLSRLSAAFS